MVHLVAISCFYFYTLASLIISYVPLSYRLSKTPHFVVYSDIQLKQAVSQLKVGSTMKRHVRPSGSIYLPLSFHFFLFLITLASLAAAVLSLKLCLKCT
jgi:hypothetical protein